MCAENVQIEEIDISNLPLIAKIWMISIFRPVIRVREQIKGADAVLIAFRSIIAQCRQH